MKRKNLEKKIRVLEARLQKGAKKLAKLKRKLTAATAAGVDKTKKKSAARARETPRSSSTKAPARPARTKKRNAPGKVKRKLNLSPERRAQLAAAMKARWAAKRAAEGNSQSGSTGGDFKLGQAAHSP
jgi:hypothetical protein